MSTGRIHVDASGGVVRLALDRPGRHNAMTADMYRDLARAVTDAAHDPGTRVLVLEGRNGAFTAGADLEAVRADPGYRDTALLGLEAIRACPVPSVAAVDGPCIGSGCAVALACDIRYATPGSSFAIPVARLGLPFEDHATARLVELVGSGRATEILVGGVRLDGRAAERFGLVERCVDDLGAAVDGLVADLLAADPLGSRSLVRSIRAAAAARRP